MVAKMHILKLSIPPQPRFAATARVAFTKFAGSNCLEAPDAEALMFALGEALANAIQHADATRIEVCLSFRAGSGLLSVADDGKGLTDLDGSIRPGHYGLTGMKERASEIGADFQLVTGPVRGTTRHEQLRNNTAVCAGAGICAQMVAITP